MSVSDSISRLAIYYKRNGCRETCRRAARALSRTLFSNRMVLFHCDLSTLSSSATELPRYVRVERKKNEADVRPQDLQEIVLGGNSNKAGRAIRERFEQGASLWMIKSEGLLAGYGWTLKGRTIEPHYFRLGQDDVHLFDFYVFPPFRGRRLNPLLVTEILRELASECGGRAFIEAAEWNHPQLASLRKTSFRCIGCARKLRICRSTIVCWDETKTLEPEPKDEPRNASPATSDRKGSDVPDLRD